MHIASFHNCAIDPSILRTCRGIYAELHKTIRSRMINDTLHNAELIISNGTPTSDDSVRVWQSTGHMSTRFELAFRDLYRVCYSKASHIYYYHMYKIPSPDILGTLLTFSIRLQLWSRYDADSLYTMLNQISKELTHVRRIRVSPMQGVWLDFMTDEQISRMNRVLQIFITLPTVREICFDERYREDSFGNSFEGLAGIQTILTQNHIHTDGNFIFDEGQYILRIDRCEERLMRYYQRAHTA
jgi:hypothetical protein